MQNKRLTTILFTVAFALCLSASVGRATAAETHFLDETLSLTGDCSTSKLDLIPDPGCPGGTHPPEPLANPSSVTTDSHGDIYVVSQGPIGDGFQIDPDGGRIDIFNPSGHYLTELTLPGAKVIAVDSTGHLYVGAECSPPWPCGSLGTELLRFDPTVYTPQTGEISYGNSPVRVPLPEHFGIRGISVNPANQHLFVNDATEIKEFGPPTEAEPNTELEGGIGASVIGHSSATAASVAVDAAHELLYVTDNINNDYTAGVVRAFELKAPHDLVRTIDGSTTPEGKFSSALFQFAVAPEEATGHIFVADFEGGRVIYEFEEDGSYVATIPKHGFESEYGYIHVDNSPESANQGYLFVPAGHAVPGHSFAYRPKPQAHPPVVESVSTSGVGQTEGVLRATVNPEGSATHYVFQYTTQQSFEAEGFANALSVGSGDLASGVTDVSVSAPLMNLSPGTSYRFRVRVESQCEPESSSPCSDEDEGSFTTFASPLEGGSCENIGQRSGPSAFLPDCRAYELITPPDTNGFSLHGAVSGPGGAFGTPTMSANGDALAFVIRGGPIPGTNGAGGFNGDSYLSTRSPSGWQTAIDGPSGEQSPVPAPGGLSPDLGYISWSFGGLGEGENAFYIRYPDGSFHLTGEGTLESDLRPTLHYIAPEASHVIFSSDKQLLEGATGAEAIYDRTADGVLHLVSLLPGDVASVAAVFRGRSGDGTAIAFTTGSSSPLYLRVDDAETLEAGPSGAEFAGLSDDGHYLFYVRTGDFFRFDAWTGETIEIAASGNAEPVNVPASGSDAYFVSSSKLTGEANPDGAGAVNGKPNLYYWDGARTRFVATVTAEDLEGKEGNIGGPGHFGGLREWMKNLAEADLGYDPTRSSRQGSTLLFLSHANLTPYDAEGHAEAYRYDAGEGTLICISCDPIGSAPGLDAKLITFGNGTVLNRYSLAANLSEDGRRAFFESSDRLVAGDTDGVQDVYEWEAEDEGSCRDAGGCLFLVSSGQSARPNYFFGASASGDDVAFSTSDLLTPADAEETPSIYDARVEGGFPSTAPSTGECLGEACQPAVTPPQVVSPASSTFQGAGNVRESGGCPKGERTVRRHGTARCVKSHPKRGKVRRKRHRRHAKKHKKPRNRRQGRSVR